MSIYLNAGSSRSFTTGDSMNFSLRRALILDDFTIGCFASLSPGERSSTRDKPDVSILKRTENEYKPWYPTIKCIFRRVESWRNVSRDESDFYLLSPVPLRFSASASTVFAYASGLSSRRPEIHTISGTVCFMRAGNGISRGIAHDCDVDGV